MKLKINKDSLIRAIGLIIEAVDNHHPMNELRNIKVKLEQNTLTLTASDLEVELTNTLALPEGACLQEGEITIPAEKFFNVCRLLPEEMALIDTSESEGRCFISSGRGKYTLSTLPSENYPSIGKPNNEKKVKITQNSLYDLIRHTRFAMATQDVRHYLTGMLIEVEENKLTAVTTDGHRLAVAYRSLEESYEEIKVIFPGKAVSSIEKLLLEFSKNQDENTLVVLGLDEEFLNVTLDFGNDMKIDLTARLISGKFPDYRRVLPTGNDKIAIFNKDEMVSVLKRIAVVNTKTSPGVLFNFKENEIISVTSSNKEHDEAIEEFNANYTGEPIEISFNEAYLRAVLAGLEGDIKLEMSHPNSQTLIYQDGDENNHQYVVMPMRV